MDINDERIGLDRLEAYRQKLVSLDRELVLAAASGQYRKAGQAFAKLLQLQADHKLLPDQDGYAALLAQLNGIPSRVLGIA